MKRISKIFALLTIAALTFTSCEEDDPTIENGQLTLNINGLEDLGADYAYEGWIIVNGAAVTTGVFNVGGSGNLNKTSFEVDQEDLDAATAFVLTIEPSPDPDPAPSSVHILAGDLNGSSANLTVDHSSAIGSDFRSATGSYILATPTDGENTNENSGVWWLDPSAGPGPGLDLPTLPNGWIYEGWVVIDGVPVSTGTFATASGADNFDGFSGAESGPNFPGEDLLVNAPDGLSFPVDIAGRTVVISVEPVPDNSPAPFALKPLLDNVPENAIDHTLYQMTNNAVATNPTGTATR